MKKPVQVALLSAALVLAAGCASTGRPVDVEAQVAGTYGRGDSSANQPTVDLLTSAEADPSQMALTAWWQAFGDQRMNRLISTALEANRDLASAGLRLQRARASAERAGVDLWPRFSGSVDSSVSREIDTDGPSTRSHRASVGLSWEIDLWGKLRAQRDVAQWEAEATAEDRDATALALVANTANLYWTLTFLNQRLAAGTESLARVEKTLGLVRVQFEAGAVSRIELREAEQSLVTQRAAQLTLEQQRVETRNALTVLLDGRPWPIGDEPQTMAIQASPGVSPGLPAELLGRRPDLRAAELRLRSALAGIDIASTSYYPTLSLTGSAGGTSTSLADVLANPVATLGAGLSLPFLDWQGMKFDTEAARIDHAIAVNDFRKLLYTAFTEVDNALSAKERLAGQVALAEQALANARQIERLYEVRYRAGAVALRIWLDAQQARRDAELSLAQLKLEQLDNDVTLILALGGTDVTSPAEALAMKPAQ